MSIHMSAEWTTISRLWWQSQQFSIIANGIILEEDENIDEIQQAW